MVTHRRILSPLADPRKGKNVNHLRLLAADVGATLARDTRKIDPDLDAVIESWPDLPDAIKTGIVAMVKGVVGNMEDAGKAKAIGKRKRG